MQWSHGAFYTQNFSLNRRDQKDYNSLMDGSFAGSERPSRVAGFLKALARVVKANEGAYKESLRESGRIDGIDTAALVGSVLELQSYIMQNTHNPYAIVSRERRPPPSGASR